MLLSHVPLSSPLPFAPRFSPYAQGRKNLFCFSSQDPSRWNFVSTTVIRLGRSQPTSGPATKLLPYCTLVVSLCASYLVSSTAFAGFSEGSCRLMKAIKSSSVTRHPCPI